MDILESLEMRWFVDDDTGTTAAAAQRAFDGVAGEGEREDRYLLTGRLDLGFKARVEDRKPAKIETKYLVASLGTAKVSDRIEGVVERWRKLSLTITDPNLAKDGTWVRVKKMRQLRKFAYQGGVVAPVNAKARPEAGCGFELTALEYEGAGARGRALTVGLEAFGSQADLPEILRLTRAAAFAVAPDLHLEEAGSESYPRWLARLAVLG